MRSPESGQFLYPLRYEEVKVGLDYRLSMTASPEERTLSMQTKRGAEPGCSEAGPQLRKPGPTRRFCSAGFSCWTFPEP